jgi:DNA-binding NtrC family response regulator
MILERAGYQVIMASSAAIARELWNLRQNDIDLLLSDIALPGGVSGWDLAREMQGDKPGVRVLLVSGCNTEALNKDFVLPATLRFLPKPFDAQSLLRMVRACFEITSR